MSMTAGAARSGGLFAASPRSTSTDPPTFDMAPSTGVQTGAGNLLESFVTVGTPLPSLDKADKGEFKVNTHSALSRSSTH